jgi:flagellar biosynthesis/type III secretory pathway M-ring protein FliF/YscJ
VCIAGYEVGNSYEKLIHAAGVFGYVLVGLIVAAVILLLVARRVRERRRAAGEAPPALTPAAGEGAGKDVAVGDDGGADALATVNSELTTPIGARGGTDRSETRLS